MQHSVLAVDDAKMIRDLLSDLLGREGFIVYPAINGHAAIQLAAEKRPDVALLDIMLPDMEGLEVLQSLMQLYSIPAMMLSARTETEYIVKYLEAGAEDYITKPFNSRQLVARINAVLRRHYGEKADLTPNIYRNEDFEINFSSRLGKARGKDITLTQKENQLLKKLAANAGEVIQYEHLLKCVWGDNYSNELWYVHNIIRQLRKKLEPEPSNPRYIKNISGVGYLFDI